MLNVKKMLTKLLPLAYTRPTTGWEQIYQNYTIAQRKGNVVSVQGYSGGSGITLTAGGYKQITTLPSQYRPSVGVYFFVSALGGAASIFGNISPEGVVQLYSNTATPYWAFSVSYTVD